MVDAAAIRPRFEVRVLGSSQETLGRLRRHLERADFGCRGWVAPPYAELEVQAATKHFWSPRLAIYATDEGGKCSLYCRFQPEPSVWTMYMAGWGISIVSGACGIAWLCAQLMMTRSLTMPLVALGVVGVVACTLYASALLGQRLGTDQMVELRDALVAALDDGPRI
jgi:hypothetical protein